VVGVAAAGAGSGSAITEVLVQARAINGTRENFIFGERGSDFFKIVKLQVKKGEGRLC